MTMDGLKLFLKSLTGASNPLWSLSFWAVLLISGIPAALAQFFGITVDGTSILSVLNPDLSAGDRLAAILAILGIRRRLK